jgi:hypothetical protein
LGEKELFEDLGVDIRIILKRILEIVIRCALASCDSGHGLVADFSEHGKETSFSIMGFVGQVGNCQTFRRRLCRMEIVC